MKPYNALWHHQGTSQTVPAKCRTFLLQVTNHAPFRQRKYSHTVRLLFILIENGKFFKPICLPFGAWFSLWLWLAAASSIRATASPCCLKNFSPSTGPTLLSSTSNKLPKHAQNVVKSWLKFPYGGLYSNPQRLPGLHFLPKKGDWHHLHCPRASQHSKLLPELPMKCHF